MFVIPRKMVCPHTVRRDSKSQGDSKNTTRSKFTTRSIFSTAGSFGLVKAISEALKWL